MSNLTAPAASASPTETKPVTPETDFETWKAHVQIQQQKYYVLLGNRQWDSIPILKHPRDTNKEPEADAAATTAVPNELETDIKTGLPLAVEFLTVLERKIAFGLYGLPSRIPAENELENPNMIASTVNASVSDKKNSSSLPSAFTDIDIGYTEEQMALVHKISSLTKEHSSRPQVTKDCLWFSCIFICGKHFNSDLAFTTPLFKFMKFDPKCSQTEELALHSGKEMFIDMDCRIYNGFSDWLKNNMLPPSRLCYPTEGIYRASSGAGSDGAVDLSFSDSPSSFLSTRVVSWLDKASLLTSLSSAGVGIATLATLPVSAPVISVAGIAGILAGGYAVCKAGSTIVDRAVHSQPIGLDDPASRNLWLHLVGGTLGAVHLRLVGAMSNAAHAGHLVSKAEEIGFLLVHVGEITSSGLEVIKSAVELSQKYERDELNPLDMYHFMASCLFFGHDLVTFQTAGEIIKQVQTDLVAKEAEAEAEEEIKAETELPVNPVIANKLSSNPTMTHQELLGQRAAELQGKKEVYKESVGVVKELNHVQNAQQFYSTLSERSKTCDTPDGSEDSSLGSFVLI